MRELRITIDGLEKEDKKNFQKIKMIPEGKK